MNLLITPRGTNAYLQSLSKRIVDLLFALIFLVLLTPLIVLVSIILIISIGRPVIFTQLRMGKNNRPFLIYKFRTMKKNASKLQSELMAQNEADGPVFKIKNDPRFIGPGKFLAQTGLDEIPQLLNVIKGDMSLVGPRPLPLKEANKLTQQQKSRHQIRPGLTSQWVLSGSHNISFQNWMKLDQNYLKHASFRKDLEILITTCTMVISMCYHMLFGKN